MLLKSRRQLLNKLQQVSPGLATREIMDQSASFIFEGDKILTFNDEIMCIASYNSKITGAVHAKPLLSLLNKIPDEQVFIAVQDNQFYVEGQKAKKANSRRRAGITMNAEILLSTESVEDPKDWQPLHPDFSNALDIVKDSASKDDLFFNLTCLHITPNYVEACDGHQATRYALETGLKNECLIKKDSVVALQGLIDSLPSEEDDKKKKLSIQVSEGQSWIHFRSKELQVSCRRWVEDYVDLDDLLDFTGEKITLPGGLGEAVDCSEIFSQDNAEENLVEIKIRKNKLRIKGLGAHGWYEQISNVSYTGPDLAFLAPPKLLAKVTKMTNDCHITKDRLKIDAGTYVFAACLGSIGKDD